MATNGPLRSSKARLGSVAEHTGRDRQTEAVSDSDRCRRGIGSAICERFAAGPASVERPRSFLASGHSPTRPAPPSAPTMFADRHFRSTTQAQRRRRKHALEQNHNCRRLPRRRRADKSSSAKASIMPVGSSASLSFSLIRDGSAGSSWVAMPVVVASRCGLNVDDRSGADLESERRFLASLHGVRLPRGGTSARPRPRRAGGVTAKAEGAAHQL